MWGTLHASARSKKLIGWLVNTWTENGPQPRLQPKMHWVTRDGKFHHMHVSVDFPQNSLSMGEEDTEIEVIRAAFILKTLSLWEEEWLKESANGDR